jgi:hypothetical protein
MAQAMGKPTTDQLKAPAGAKEVGVNITRLTRTSCCLQWVRLQAAAYRHASPTALPRGRLLQALGLQSLQIRKLRSSARPCCPGKNSLHEITKPGFKLCPSPESFLLKYYEHMFIMELSEKERHHHGKAVLLPPRRP